MFINFILTLYALSLNDTKYAQYIGETLVIKIIVVIGDEKNIICVSGSSRIQTLLPPNEFFGFTVEA